MTPFGGKIRMLREKIFCLEVCTDRFIEFALIRRILRVQIAGPFKHSRCSCIDKRCVQHSDHWAQIGTSGQPEAASPTVQNEWVGLHDRPKMHMRSLMCQLGEEEPFVEIGS